MQPRAAAALLAVLALCTPALAATRPTAPAVHPRPAPTNLLDRSYHLWATVDLCSTRRHPSFLGLRGSMPRPTRRGLRMFMRFQVQYRTSAGRWIFVGPSGDSRFFDVSSGRTAVRQSGRSFKISPARGMSYLLRGMVTFQWRSGRRVVDATQKATTPGHFALAGSDPPGYSAATCRIRGARR